MPADGPPPPAPPGRPVSGAASGGRPGGPPRGRPEKLGPVDDCAALVLPADAADADAADTVTAAEAAGCWPIVVVPHPGAVGGRVPASAALAVIPGGTELPPEALAAAALRAGFEALTGGYEPSRTVILTAGDPASEEDVRAAVEVSKAGGESGEPTGATPAGVRFALPSAYPTLRDGTTPSGTAG